MRKDLIIVVGIIALSILGYGYFQNLNRKEIAKQKELNITNCYNKAYKHALENWNFYCKQLGKKEQLGRKEDCGLPYRFAQSVKEERRLNEKMCLERYK